MNVLILGYSDIAQRRGIPALQAAGATRIAVASRSRSIDDDTLTRFTDYAQALRDWRPQLVYISLRNEAHAPWAERSLLAGAHTVIDKPAVLHADEARHLTHLAAARQLALAEATVYAWHPQMARIQDWVHAHGNTPLHAEARFCFPDLPAGNFRYQPEYGGGMLHDLGPYAVSIGRLLFGRQPEHLEARILARHPDTGVDLGFTLQADYGQGRTLQGRFACGETYRNSLHLISGKQQLHVERLFTTPPELSNRLSLADATGSHEEALPAADAFQRFFEALFQAINQGRHRHFAETLLADADARQRLRHATEGKPA